MQRSHRLLWSLVVLTIVLAGVWSALAGPLQAGTLFLQAAPANDNFASAALLSGGDGTVTGTNVGATAEAGEPAHAEEPASHSVWYAFTPGSGSVTIDTVGSTFDTVLAVYTGTTVAALTEVTSDDDGGPDLQSQVTFDSVAGTTYRIAVDGADGEAGAVVLHWAFTSAPANDDFASATLLSGGAGTVTGTNVGASAEAGEPDHANYPATHSVWYAFTPGSGSVTIDTFGSGFDTVLAVYTGTTVSGLTEVESNDDGGPDVQSQLTFDAVAGTTYRIAVDGVDETEGRAGGIVLNWKVEGGAGTGNPSPPTGSGAGSGAGLPARQTLGVLTYTGPTSAAPGMTITLSAKLKPETAGETVGFTLNRVTLRAKTNTSGIASVRMKAPATVGSYRIGIVFDGDATTAAASISPTLSVARTVPVLKYAAPTSAVHGASITLSATLKTRVGKALSRKTVRFTLNGVALRAKTNASGVASVRTKAPATVGLHRIAIAFARDTTYAAASANATLTVS